LKKGEVQVNEKEREHDLTSLRKEIATLVAEKCVDPATQRPYPVGMIEKAMAEAGVSVKTGKNAKSQVGRSLLVDTSFVHCLKAHGHRYPKPCDLFRADQNYLFNVRECVSVSSFLLQMESD
jgi:hypothetical protein